MLPAGVVDVAVIGGGISGLAAAYELQRRGLRVRVLEAGTRPGGVIVTERHDGWVIDGGPDSMLVQKPAAVALCRELGIADRLVSTLQPRTAYVMRDGWLHPIVEGSFLGFPVRVSALARSSLFSVGGKVRMACEAFVPAARGEDDESIASFVRRRFGEEAVDYLAEPLLAGIHAGDVDRLSIRALFPRLVDAERQAGSVIRSFRALRATPSPQGAFVSLPGGTGELVEALSSALTPGTVALSARVTDLRRAGAYSIESPAGVVQAKAVILCVPAFAAAHLLRGFDTTLAGLCDAIPYASTATVAFGFTRDQVPHPMRGSGYVVPRAEHTSLLAATWVTSKWPGRAPDGHVLLRGFLGGGRDPHRLERSDEELIAAAREELTETLAHHRRTAVQPAVPLDAAEPAVRGRPPARVAAIERRVASIPGLFLAGSGFRAIGIPDCIADGRDTATRAAAVHPTRRRPEREERDNRRMRACMTLVFVATVIAVAAQVPRPRAVPDARFLSALRLRPAGSVTPQIEAVLQEHQGRRQGPARGLGGGRPLPARPRGHARREVDSRNRRRQRLQRHLARTRRARDRRPRRRHRVRPAARQGSGRRTSAGPGWPTSCAWSTATRSRRSRSCTGTSTSCSSTPGSPTTRSSSTWSSRG